MKVKIIVNNLEQVFDIKPDEYLLDTLRSNNYLSVKRGCDSSSCGVCTVLVDGNPTASCTLLTVMAENRHVTTVEGIANEAAKLSKHMGHEGADQCGFCNPSLALNVFALKQAKPNPTDHEIREFLIGNLCRCTGYQGQHIAIKRYLEEK